ncbi:hypothetical protein PGB90_010639 [Kerria lacca]
MIIWNSAHGPLVRYFFSRFATTIMKSYTLPDLPFGNRLYDYQSVTPTGGVH